MHKSGELCLLSAPVGKVGYASICTSLEAWYMVAAERKGENS
jgi:hypothetical protein